LGCKYLSKGVKGLVKVDCGFISTGASVTSVFGKNENRAKRTLKRMLNILL